MVIAITHETIDGTWEIVTFQTTMPISTDGMATLSAIILAITQYGNPQPSTQLSSLWEYLTSDDYNWFSSSFFFPSAPSDNEFAFMTSLGSTRVISQTGATDGTRICPAVGHKAEKLLYEMGLADPFFSDEPGEEIQYLSLWNLYCLVLVCVLLLS